MFPELQFAYQRGEVPSRVTKLLGGPIHTLVFSVLDPQALETVADTVTLPLKLFPRVATPVDGSIDSHDGLLEDQFRFVPAGWLAICIVPVEQITVGLNEYGTKRLLILPGDN